MGGLSHRAKYGFVLIGLIGIGVSIYWGWKTFFFLTDDAYIAFRYVSNSRAGWGLVWNPPPFVPVEGYTSFLWVILLRFTWDLTNMPPPETANILLLVFGYMTLLLGVLFFKRMQLPQFSNGFKMFLFVLAFLGIVTNRTLLTWLSSGLETALFNFFLVWWVYEGLTPKERMGPVWTFRLCSSAALSALSRPDGLLVVGMTLAILITEQANAFVAYRNGRANTPLAACFLSGSRFWGYLSIFPLSAVVFHVLWRKFTYGEWLPNTYYAKYSGIWIESGWRYAASFIVEYGVWVWLAVALLLGIRNMGWIFRKKDPNVWWNLRPFMVIFTIVAHLVYYTCIIGGDHFEYRVYSYLPLLLWVSAVWLVVRVTKRKAAMVGILGFFFLVSLPIPWVHWSKTRDLHTRKDTNRLAYPVSEHFPAGVKPIVAEWDKWQKWLIEHLVCVRHQEHKSFYQYQMAKLPSREVGAQIRWDDRGIMKALSVGVLGWVFKEVAIIDKLGLNDRVIARNVKGPVKKIRKMAHERQSPPGYIECFKPNITIKRRISSKGEILKVGKNHGIRIQRRGSTFGDETIRRCERIYWAKVTFRDSR